MPNRAFRTHSKTAKTKAESRVRLRQMPESAGYLHKTHAAVRAELGAAEPLPAFLSRAGGLTLEDRRCIVQQAMVVMEQNVDLSLLIYG
jgi:hypothetical protein